MAGAFEDNYHLIASVSELPSGQPQIFRAGGTIVVVLLNAKGQVSAIDGSCVSESARLSSDQRVQRTLEGVARLTGARADDWISLHSAAGLPVRVENGKVWICLDDCSP